MAQFHLLQPLWLLIIPLLVGLSYIVCAQSRSAKHWSMVCDPELLPLLVVEQRSRQWARFVLLSIVSVLLGVALAQPVWQQQPQPAYQQEDALVIALDLSASMAAQDLKPSRLERARFKIRDLLAKQRDGQVALLVYAADAFVVTPLTQDAATIDAQLAAMSPDIMPRQGSRADRALQLAENLLQQAGIQAANILLVTDEIHPAQVAAESVRLKQTGHQVSLLGVGTEQGANIPTASGVLMHNGTAVVAKLAMSNLQEVASLGGGRAVLISPSDADLDYLMSGFLRGGDVVAAPSQVLDEWVAEGPWLVLLALPFLLPLFRRGALNLLLPAIFVGALTSSHSVHANETSWWQTADQRGAAALSEGDAARAAALFTDPRWKQIAEAHNGDLAAALEALPHPESADDWYNRGNLLAQSGALEEALSAYDQTLEIAPEMADAKHNRAQVKQLLEEQTRAENGSQPNQEQGDQAQSDSSENSDAQNSDDQNGETQGNESQAGESNQAESDANNAAEQSQSNEQQGGQDNSTPAGTEEPQASAGDQAQEGKDQQQLQEAFKQALDERQAQGEDATAVESTAATAPPSEAEQARQQLLNRIEDDPAGLWRRKFRYQYQRDAAAEQESKPW
ncbi:VWA domain-containing protein [Neptunomonas sp. XY-337]|uniref:VWA domain-containing protein n=1 Tax=Neptunomonas sp. XY-337 TaxID=2561897 RepID=UPI00145B1B1C|nr:VWA domain-containing protein [Neptunomonas sp. XY-337]